MPKNRQIYFIGMLTCCLLGLTRESFFRESHEVKRLAQHFLREYILILFSSCIFDPWKCELAFVPSISSQSFMTAVRETLTLDLQTKCLRVIKKICVNRTPLSKRTARGSVTEREKNSPTSFLTLRQSFCVLHSRSYRPFAHWRHSTTTTRILFVFPFVFKFCKLSEVWITKALNCTRKENAEGFWSQW